MIEVQNIAGVQAVLEMPADDELHPDVVPGNVIDGLYYGLLSATDLAKGFSEPKTWVRAENGSVVLEAVKTGGAGFYKVKVSDIAR